MNYFVFLFSFISLHVFAFDQITSQIKEIDYGSSVDQQPLIFLSNGQVIKVNLNRYDQLNELNKMILTKEWLKIYLNDKREIQSFEIVPNPQSPLKSAPLNIGENAEEFVPSILKSIDQARTYFNDSKFNPKNSQCYNRAHVWAYDWRVKYKIYSTKVWIFFTRRYIREFDFEWWFHVSPIVHVMVDGEVKERVMDIKYSKGPLKINQWTNIFMRNSAGCPIVDKYTDQADFPESGHCFLMKSSMYYYQPIDLERLQFEGLTRNRWIGGEVRHAFEEAFDIFL